MAALWGLDVWTLAAIASKFALYLGALGASGTVFATLLFRLEGTRWLAIGFGALGLGAALLAFAVRAAALTGDASGMSDPEMLGLLWSTPVGTALLYRVAGFGLLILALFCGRIGLWAAACCGLLALWSFDHVGHIPSRDVALLDVALTLHLVALALWIGILTPLKRLASHPATSGQAAEVGHRFGRIAAVTVPVLIVAGGYMGYQLVGSFSALFGTGYGQALLLKVFFVALLLGLAALNKLRFVPALRSGNPTAAAHLRKSILLEWAIVLGVLALTALLTSHLSLPT